MRAQRRVLLIAGLVTAATVAATRIGVEAAREDAGSIRGPSRAAARPARILGASDAGEGGRAESAVAARGVPGTRPDAAATGLAAPLRDRGIVLRDPDGAAHDGTPALHRGDARPVQLDALAADPGDVTGRVEGFDPYAPRALTLWRILDGRAAPVAQGASDERGALAFPPVLKPRDGMQLVATGRGADEDAALALRALEVPPAPPQAPRVVTSAGDAGGVRLRVAVSPADGALRVRAAGRETVLAVPPRPDAAEGVVELWIPRETEGASVSLAHERPDGRLSGWRALTLSENGAAGEGAE